MISNATLIFAAGFPFNESLKAITPTAVNLISFLVMGRLAPSGWFILFMILAAVWQMATMVGPRLWLRNRAALRTDQPASQPMQFSRFCAWHPIPTFRSRRLARLTSTAYMVLSRIRAAPSAYLGHFALEGQGAFSSQC